jgi:hypothetical protein
MIHCYSKGARATGHTSTSPLFFLLFVFAIFPSHHVSVLLPPTFYFFPNYPSLKSYGWFSYFFFLLPLTVSLLLLHFFVLPLPLFALYFLFSLVIITLIILFTILFHSYPNYSRGWMSQNPTC